MAMEMQIILYDFSAYFSDGKGLRNQDQRGYFPYVFDTSSVCGILRSTRREAVLPSLFLDLRSLGIAIEFMLVSADGTFKFGMNKQGRNWIMLETIIVILLVLWLLGLVAGQTFGGILHVLLLVAVVVFVIRLLTGRAAV